MPCYREFWCLLVRVLKAIFPYGLKCMLQLFCLPRVRTSKNNYKEENPGINSTRACVQTKKCGKESTLFNYIHKHSFRGFSVHSLVQKSRVYPRLFRSNYFHKESTLFEKSAIVTTGIFHLINLNTWLSLRHKYICFLFAIVANDSGPEPIA
jgi:hypothetical protein